MFSKDTDIYISQNNRRSTRSVAYISALAMSLGAIVCYYSPWSDSSKGQRFLQEDELTNLAESSAGTWTTYGDTSLNTTDGTYRLNGNPGSVDDFVRSTESYSRPIYCEATFDAGWKGFYPLIEIVADELTRAIPDIGGLSNYLPTDMNMNFHQNQHYPSYNWTIDGDVPLTLSVYAHVNGTVTYGVKNGNNSGTWNYDDGDDFTSGYVYISNRAGVSD